MSEAQTYAREPRADKVAVVDEVRAKVDEAAAVLLTEYRGLDVAALARLRRSLREVGGEYHIYKNSLVRRAVADLDMADGELDRLTDLLLGPTALAFVQDDAAAVAKALRDFARTHDALVIKGGMLGDRLVDETQVRALADLPSRDDLLARLAGGLQAPMQRFAGLLYGTLAKFAYAVNALIEERGGPAEGGEPAAGDEPAASDEPQPEPSPRAEVEPGVEEGMAAVAGDEAESASSPSPAAAEEAGTEPAEQA